MSRRPCPAKEPETVWCDCPIRSGCALQEFRAMARPGGKKRALEEYMDLVRQRQAELEKIRGGG